MKLATRVAVPLLAGIGVAAVLTLSVPAFPAVTPRPGPSATNSPSLPAPSHSPVVLEPLPSPLPIVTGHPGSPRPLPSRSPSPVPTACE